MKLWDKGISVDQQVLRYTVGDDFILDRKLVKYDCIASIAHAKMLAKMGVLQSDETEKLERALLEIVKLAEQGKFEISPEQEDCHTAIENYLTEKLGDLGKKIHTARSRNDQVVTALRLLYKDELQRCERLVGELKTAISGFAEKFGQVVFPGYTHTRKAMPSSISLWATAFMDSLEDDGKILQAVVDLIDQSPLGTGAGYGVPLEIDREFMAELLGFKRVQKNPLYVQNSRGKFESAILFALNQIMYDLNKMASDLILFSLPDFGYFDLPDELCTGSSIMPQKKNPDVLELIRANYQVTVSYEFQVKQLNANLISGYHRDLQLTKKPVLQGIEITKSSLEMLKLIFQNLQVNEEACGQAMTEEIYATEKVYQLVKQGVPFRDAYKKVSRELFENK